MIGISTEAFYDELEKISRSKNVRRRIEELGIQAVDNPGSVRTARGKSRDAGRYVISKLDAQQSGGFARKPGASRAFHVQEGKRAKESASKALKRILPKGKLRQHYTTFLRKKLRLI